MCIRDSAGSGSIGFFYYSGHGAARPEDGANYLIPVDVQSLQLQSAWYDAISLDAVVHEVARRASKETALFFVFDACRTELHLPIKSISKGFEDIRGQSGSFIAFSTSPGQTASDVGDEGGPYARALSAELRNPNQDYLTVFKRVKEAVYSSTRFTQHPWEHDGIIGTVVLNANRLAPNLSNSPQLAAPALQSGATISPPPPPPPPRPRSSEASLPAYHRLQDIRDAREEQQDGNRTIINEPGRFIIRDPSSRSYVRHNDLALLQIGARDVRTETVGGDKRTVVIRPDNSEIISVAAPDGRLIRRIGRGSDGREIIIIDNTYRDPRSVNGMFIDIPPPVVRIPYDRYIVDYDSAPSSLVYDTLLASSVVPIDRRYSMDEIRYSRNVSKMMPSVDINTINLTPGSWEFASDQEAKLKPIAYGLKQALQRNPREVFLIEGHTDDSGSEIDNLSLSDRRAEALAAFLIQQLRVPTENLVSQGYGSQYLKEQNGGLGRTNQRFTIRRITPLLNGGSTPLPPAPPGTSPPR
ncbi:caspase family protein [Bradyrhizobium campsiandrae]|uniref:Caspase family protein n=1 Tax=Bradyrhizobium campsiandrae TaxID=1729892 RepID=A0ABR7UDM8_9BRAD|nr:caspase family protein [Bradyrhizobium campsiandrae]MBC9982179.1 caspase family protein [Bradyrhizobium campsiandrae]